MIEKITLDALTRDSVSLKKQNFIEQDGIKYAVGDIWRKAYTNTIRGRLEVESEVIEPYKSVILLMWGSEPTLFDDEQ